MEQIQAKMERFGRRWSKAPDSPFCVREKSIERMIRARCVSERRKGIFVYFVLQARCILNSLLFLIDSDYTSECNVFLI